MAGKIQFPLFAPPKLLPSTARWNQQFLRRDRTQQHLEHQIRFERRHDSALTIAHNYNPAPPHLTTSKSTGTPSPHPAFEPPRKIKTPTGENNPAGINFRIDENGVSYEMSEAPFVYQYSYTETPKVKPVKLREPLVSPFGPATMDRPWLGRKPFPPCKKDLPEFDSYQLPPPHKKGVKPVQPPGPYLSGSGPKYVRSREEVLGEPLTNEEIEDLIQGSKKTTRQLNIGRDGLTHNMLDNIHGLWKRKRVCRIRCKGVCTVDMDNVCQQLEEKSGGKIIYNRGGVIYLFRGRNYNYKSRPRYPIMLWKPSTPVYPRLVKRVPEGLTLEEATDMRKRGHDLIPICKLGKNGVYCDLVKNVREAFEACELVRINCQGMNPSDYKKIGAKLKDLVPCVLLSFECEHILMWRGRDWKSTMEPSESMKGLQEVKVDVEGLSPSASESKDSETNLPLTYYSNEESQGNDEIVIKVPERDTTLQSTESSRDCTEGILLLRKEAVENGMAFVFDDRSLDAETVFKMVASFSKTAPTGPVFGKRCEQLEVEVVSENVGQECEEGRGVRGTGVTAVGKKGRKGLRDEKIKEVKAGCLNVVPDGNLRVDELAKLLA